MAVGRVGERVPRGIRTVRVDRPTPLGNPYVMRDEADRDDVCDAYRQLLGESLAGHVSMRRVSEIGACHGFLGAVRPWDSRGACEEMERLRRIREVHDMRLDCHCAPARCHAEEIIRLM